MSSVPDNTNTPPPSIFISYASGDRAAVRLLGETLKQAGLDVWLDEEELAGGDAWDAKIRQQIRACTYFMPVISATTEARREGYFRREWRLAVERTLDHADDVLFLTPVAIDDTRDQGARVPEKFMSVQWLRCPGGKETPQLVELARRLAAGPDAAVNAPPAPRPEDVPPPLARGQAAKGQDKDGGKPPPPFRAFPAFPEERSKRARFLYDLLLWCGHTVVALWHRLPRWVRVLVMLYIVYKLVTGIFGTHEQKPARETSAEKIAAAKKIGELFADQATNKTGSSEPGVSTAEKVISAVIKAADEAALADRPLAFVELADNDTAAGRTLSDVFDGLRAQLKKQGRAQDVGAVTLALPANTDEKTILSAAAKYHSRWLLVGTVKATDADEYAIAVRLYEVGVANPVWSAERTADGDAGKGVGEELGGEVLKHIDFTPAPPPPPPTQAPAPAK